MNTEEEKIIRDWIEKAKPIVESAWNLALDTAIDKVFNSMGNGVSSKLLRDRVINELSKLKKEIK